MNTLTEAQRQFLAFVFALGRFELHSQEAQLVRRLLAVAPQRGPVVLDLDWYMHQWEVEYQKIIVQRALEALSDFSLLPPVQQKRSILQFKMDAGLSQLAYDLAA